MLKKTHRLSTRQFMEIMEKGRVYTSQFFLMRVFVQDTTLRSSFGGISAVAPKKIASTAVLRNKLRRQIYHALKSIIKDIKPGSSVIIFAKKEMVQANFELIKKDIKQLFIKAKLSV